MQSLPDSANRLIEEFSRLPGIGRKTAQRLTFHLLKTDKETVYRLSDVLRDVKMKVHECSVCGGITEEDPCVICSSPKRNKNLLCIVEDGIGPDELNLSNLLGRIQTGMEIVVATNPSVEGETTALFLAKYLAKKDITVTRLARGLPVGGNLEYTDEATLIRAMEGRTSL